MGRLAVVLGSNALGPGGEAIAAAAAEHGAAIVQRHGSDGRLRPAARDRPRREPAGAGRAGLRPGAGDRLGRLAATPSCRSAACSAPTTSSPSTSASRSSATSAPTGRRGFDPGWREEVLAAWARAAAGAARRRRLLAGDRAALRDPGRDPADGRPRRRGRDDDRLGVHRRRRARPRLRRDLRRRQPRQRPRRRARSAILELEAARAANALQLHDGLAAVLPQLGAVGP